MDLEGQRIFNSLQVVFLGVLHCITVLIIDTWYFHKSKLYAKQTLTILQDIKKIDFKIAVEK